MKFPKNDVVLLLGFLLLFCFGLSFLRHDHQDVFFSVGDLDDEDVAITVNTKKLSTTCDCFDELEKNRLSFVDEQAKTTVAPRRQEKLDNLSTGQLLSYMQPLFLTKSAAAIIAFLKHIPSASVLRIVRAIVQDSKTYLPPRVKMRLVFAGAQRQRSMKEKFAFFDLFAQNQQLTKGAKPLLVKAVEAGYAHLVPDILAWAQQADVGDIATEALVYAARHDDEDPEALRELYEAGVSVNTTVASQLLHEVVSSCNEGFSIAFLIEMLGADHGAVESGATPLVKAVQDKKIAITLELLKYGADPQLEMPGCDIKTVLGLTDGPERVS